MQERSEIELIAHGRQGDEAALAELFGRHYASCLRVARGILRSKDDSQDAVQAAYLLAFRHLRRFRGEACFKTWITRIVVNCCLMQLREARRRAAWVQLEDLGGGREPHVLTSRTPSPETATWSREIASAFSEAFARLPKHLSEAYALYAASNLSLKEVAAQLGITLAATKTRLYRARAGMRQDLEPIWSGSRSRRVA
jgi:RNA polymerase sigma-70 factor (ECF subfamily)